MTNPLNEKAPLHSKDLLNRSVPADEEQVMEAPHAAAWDGTERRVQQVHPHPNRRSTDTVE